MKPPHSRKPSSLTARLLSIPVHFYRGAISPLTPPSCRFTPTCSQYALDALRLYGPIHGTAMTARRIARCHPWGGSGYDPVPVPLPDWFRNVDVHTHINPQDGSAITSIDTTQQPLPADPGPYSVGIHPWNAHLATDDAFRQLAQAAAHPSVVAIGECGLDKLRGPELALQMAVFRRQAELAESLRLPLIIHCVRASEQLLALHKELRPTVPWIYHGFRGKPQQAQQLTAHGIYLSLGPNHNPAVPAAVPPHLLLHETDTQ